MQKIVLIITVALLMSGCGKNAGEINLKFKAETGALKSSLSNLEGYEVSITDFRLSIRDVEFKQDESELDSNEIQFKGPYEIDLLDGTDAPSQTIGVVEVPDGTYKVLRFKLHKSRDREESHPLYDRSVYIKGTIDGVEFEFWHDTSENFDVENSGGIVVSAGLVNITVKFDVAGLLASKHAIDFSLAKDENENGTIEINPDNDDDNGDIADLLKQNIKEAADLIKE